MYAKTNPRAGRLTPRQKRIFAITAVLVIVVFGGLTAWGVVAHDSYRGFGARLRERHRAEHHRGVHLSLLRGGGAVVLPDSFRSQDQVSLRARPQCVLAGLGPSADPSAGVSK